LQPYMAEWRERGLDVVLVSSDRPDRLESFIKQHNLAATALLDPDWQVHRLYQVQGLPTSVFLDREGKVKHSSVGWGPKHFADTLYLAENLIGPAL